MEALLIFFSSVLVAALSEEEQSDRRWAIQFVLERALVHGPSYAARSRAPWSVPEKELLDVEKEEWRQIRSSRDLRSDWETAEDLLSDRGFEIFSELVKIYPEIGETGLRLSASRMMSHEESATTREGPSAMERELRHAGVSLPSQGLSQVTKRDVDQIVASAEERGVLELAVDWLLASGVPPHMIFLGGFIVRYRWLFYPTVFDLLPERWQKAVDEAVRRKLDADPSAVAKLLEAQGIGVSSSERSP